MKPCPHCKEKCGFISNGFMEGPAYTYFDEDGLYAELHTDRLVWKRKPKVIRCANCGKIRKDIKISKDVSILTYVEVSE